MEKVSIAVKKYGLNNLYLMDIIKQVNGPRKLNSWKMIGLLSNAAFEKNQYQKDLMDF